MTFMPYVGDMYSLGSPVLLNNPCNSCALHSDDEDVTEGGGMSQHRSSNTSRLAIPMLKDHHLEERNYKILSWAIQM